MLYYLYVFFFSSRRRHTRCSRDWSSDVCSSDLSNAGTSNANNDNQRTGGGSQVQLRNLPTLVLVNGRRVAIDAVAGTNGKNFVDVNQIPAAAIDHIEVLTDGASSIYGSDAIGGVVNFITKSDKQGVKAGGRFGSATGDYRERSAYLSGGTEIGGLSITATGSYSEANPLFQGARSFTRDWKSRRLNSSPGYTSYAVFCLQNQIRSWMTP